MNSVFIRVILVVFFLSCAYVISYQNKSLKRIAKLQFTPVNKAVSLENRLREIEKSKQTVVYTTRQEFRDVPITFNYTSLSLHRKVSITNFKGDVVFSAKDIPSYRLNLYSLENGFEDLVNLNEVPFSGEKDGYYFIRVEDQSGSHTHPFIYNTKSDCDVLVVASTNTWNAYSDWYTSYIARAKKVGREEAKKVLFPYARPMIDDSGTAPQTQTMARKEAVLQDFLETKGYDYCVISNLQYDSGLAINNYKIIILPYYSEFWSKDGKLRLKNDLARGVSLLSLSAGTMFREIQYYENGIRVTKSVAEDEFKAISTLIGTHYWFTDPFRKEDQADFKILEPQHWVFAGVKGNSFGTKNEFFSAASAWEADLLYDESNGFKRIAKGQNKTSRNQADVVYKMTEGGGFVLNFSSLGIIGSIRVDSNATNIVKNVLDRAIAKSSSK